MTSPFSGVLRQYEPPAGLLSQYEPTGPSYRPAYDAEINARVKEWIDSLMENQRVQQRLQERAGATPPLATVAGSSYGTPPASVDQPHGGFLAGLMRYVAQPNPIFSLLGMGASSTGSQYIEQHGARPELLGALSAYGPGAAQAPPQGQQGDAQLAQQLQSLRAERDAQPGENIDAGPMGRFLSGPASGIAAGVPLGIVESVPEMANFALKALSRLPGGDQAAGFLDKALGVTAARTWFAKINENVRNSLPEEARAAFNEVPLINAVSAGKFVGMTPLNYAAFKAGEVAIEGTGIAAALGQHTVLRGIASGAAGGLAMTVGDNMPWISPEMTPGASPFEKVTAAVFGTRFGQSIFGGILGGSLAKFADHAASSPALREVQPTAALDEMNTLKAIDQAATAFNQGNGRYWLEGGMADAIARNDMDAFRVLSQARDIHDTMLRTGQPPKLPDPPAYSAPEAAMQGQQLSKQARVMQSPLLPDVVAETAQPTITLYHGGVPFEEAPGPRWLTPDRRQAEGYTGNGRILQSVDVPADHPLLQPISDVSGTSFAPTPSAFNAPEEMARGLRPVTDVQVVQSGMASNPAGISITPNVVDPQPVLAAAEQGGLNVGELAPSDVRLVEREGTFHALTSTVGPVTDEVASDYQQYGVFSGMRIQSMAGGTPREGIVLGVELNPRGEPVVRWRKPDATPIGTAEDGSTLYPIHSTPLKSVVPSLDAPARIEAPDVWATFKDWAAGRSEQPVDLLSEQGRMEMPRLLNEFLDEVGTQGLPERHALLNYFDNALVGEYRALEPEVNAAAEVTSAEAHTLAAANEESGFSVPATVEDLAGVKGFHALPMFSGKYVLIDQATGRQMAMESEEAARQFLTNYHREAPTPDLPTVVPSEVMVEQPAVRVSNSRPPEEYEHEQAHAHYDEEDMRLAEENEANPLVMLDDGEGPQGQPLGATPVAPVPAEGELPVVPDLPGVVRNRANLEARAWNFMQRTFQPVRTVFARLEEDLDSLGMGHLRPWQQYSEVTYGKSLAHRESYDFHQQRAEIFDGIHSLPIRNGRVWRALMEAPEERHLVSGAAPDRLSGPHFGDYLTPGELEAVGRADTMMPRALSDDLDTTLESGQRRWDQIKQFVTESQGLQITEHPNSYADPEKFPDIPWFTKRAQEMNLRFETPDAQEILDTAIKSHYFNKHVAEPLDSMVETWRELGRMNMPGDGGKPPLAPIAKYVEEWANVVRRGYSGGDDLVLDWTHAFLNKFMSVSKREASGLINSMMSARHRSALGWRTAPVIRDATQPWMAAPFVGVDNLASVYGDIMRGMTPEMFERASKMLTLEKGMPPLEGTGVRQDLSAPSELMSTGRRQVAVRNILSRAGDFVRDLTPESLRTISGTKLDPMHLYTMNGEMNRVVVGEAAWRKFQLERAAFTEQVRGGDALTMPSVRGFVDKLGSGLEFAPRRLMAEQIMAGDWDSAATTFAREVADMTQFRYGAAEQATRMRSHTARAFMQFGSFSTQSVNFFARSMSNALKNSDYRQAAKILSWIGGTTAAASYADAKTGWSFGKWIWVDPRFTGGPAAVGFRKIQDLWGIVARPTGSRDQAQTLGDLVTQTPMDLATGLNPFDAVRAHIGAAIDLTNNPEPLQAAARYMVTGDSPDPGRYWREHFNRPLPAEAGYSSPMPPPGYEQTLNPNAVHPAVAPTMETGPTNPLTDLMRTGGGMGFRF